MQEDQGKGTNTSVDLTQEEAQNDNLGGNSENDTGQAWLIPVPAWYHHNIIITHHVINVSSIAPYNYTVM